MGKFDWNKMDDYKVAIDDGFNLEHYYGEEFVIKRGYEKYILLTQTDCIAEKDWETFKQKVADYFLGGDK